MRCPHCAVRVAAVFMPVAGLDIERIFAFMLCDSCLRLVVVDGGTPRKPTDEEERSVTSDARFPQVVAAVKQMKDHQRMARNAGNN